MLRKTHLDIEGLARSLWDGVEGVVTFILIYVEVSGMKRLQGACATRYREVGETEAAPLSPGARAMRKK
jgi:hypothetical protein